MRPTGLIIAAASAGAVAWFTWRARLANAGDALLLQGLGLFLPFTVIAMSIVAAAGFRLSGGGDWPRYIVPALPSLAAAAAVSACAVPSSSIKPVPENERTATRRP